MRENKKIKKQSHSPPVPDVLWIFIILFLILVAGEIFHAGADSVVGNIFENEYKNKYLQMKTREIDNITKILVRVNQNLPDSEAIRIANKIWDVTEKYEEFDIKLFVSMIIIESGVKSYVKSSAGALGLCQVMPFHINLLIKKKIFNNHRDFYDSEKNIEAAAYLLSHYLKWSDGDPVRGLAAYNAGIGNWRAGLNYATKVLRIRDKYW